VKTWEFNKKRISKSLNHFAYLLREVISIFNNINKRKIMVKTLLLFLILVSPCYLLAQKFSKVEVERYKQEAAAVKIARDQWGVPHIYGETDADAVFGLMYAECEDNFRGLERNYLYQFGKLSQVDGEASLYSDLQLQMIADTLDAIKDYKKAPTYFKKLLNAFADGINFYIYKHPEVKPRVFKHYEPWYALMFTDGSVAATVTGGLKVSDTRNFYGNGIGDYVSNNKPEITDKQLGSNGFAIAPSISASGNAMLYINPHVPFYFRDEVELESEEGLQVYGAVTWGQFFVYQGFNSHCGWMHTSSYADVGDLYSEKVIKAGGKWFYEYEGENREVTSRKIIIGVKKENRIEKKTITGFYTHHGPILGGMDGKWLALKANNRSLNALLESWLITKANTFSEFKHVMGELLSNATNNTVYADDQGNIAFWYGNFMPKRNPNFDWDLPVDGSIKTTEWKGLHSLNEIIHVYNPATGWIQNCNSTPFASSGASSPKKEKYPSYMAPNGQNFRAVNAIKLLSNSKSLTLDQLIDIGYDHYLAAFDALLPPLFTAYDAANDSVKQAFAKQIQLLKQWDKKTDTGSVATTLAIEWGNLMMKALRPAVTDEESTYQTERVNMFLSGLSNERCMHFFSEAVNSLTKKYGTWEIKWGDINRYQRPKDGVTFDDSKTSFPVGLTSSMFGQLPSYQSKTMNTKNLYGYSGNSFIAAVEFGTQIKAKSIVTGGLSFDQNSEHFTDQAKMYLNGHLKDVYFYKDDVLKHVERIYHPGK
jgi:acyl-homoserine lactone acylase PvdQ